MSCPFYDICAKQLEDIPDFNWNDPACFGDSVKDWSLCNIYQDWAFNIYRQEAAERRGKVDGNALSSS